MGRARGPASEIGIAEAAAMMPAVRRLAVFGTSGGGKSTLSRQLATDFDLPYVSHDRDVRWLPGWQVRDRQEQSARVQSFVAGPRWVIDGTNLPTLDLRLARADLAIWMRPGRIGALRNLFTRVVTYRGQVRPDMAEGCPEIWPDREFLHYIWSFEKLQAPRLLAALDGADRRVPVLVLGSRRETGAFIAQARAAAGKSGPGKCGKGLAPDREGA